MNKHELAKWVAENVLGWKRGKDYSNGEEDLVPLVFSPEGYFDVLNAVQDKFYKATISFWKNSQYTYQIDPDEGMDCGDIKCRSTNMYIAFYSTVKELYGCYKKCNKEKCNFG